MKYQVLSLVFIFIQQINAQECLGNFNLSPIVSEDKILLKENDLRTENAIKSVDSQNKKEKALVNESIEDRKLSFERMLEQGMLIYSGDLYTYVKNLSDQVVSNCGIQRKIEVYLVREESPNAFATGDDRIFIHLGLLTRITSEEQLRFVIAHELGHNELNHFEQKVKDYAQLQLNDSIQSRIKEIRQLEYAHVSELNKLMTPWILANKEKSREMEYAADNFAFEQLSVSGINLANSVRVFDIMEKFESEIDTLHFDLVGLLNIEELKLDYRKVLNPKNSSSLGSFEVEKDTLDDLLRTHPYSLERKKQFIERLGIDSVANLTTQYSDNVKMALMELVNSNLYHREFDRAVFNLLLLRKHNPSDPFVRKYLPFCFAYLAHAKEKFQAGKLISNQSPKNNDNYNDLIFFLRHLTTEQCIEIAQGLQKENNGIDPCKYDVCTKAVFAFMSGEDVDYQNLVEVERKMDENSVLISILDAIKN